MSPIREYINSTTLGRSGNIESCDLNGLTFLVAGEVFHVWVIYNGLELQSRGQ